MALKRRRSQETLSGNGHSYLFDSTFGNIQQASFQAGEPGLLYSRLLDGELPPDGIYAVISACVEQRDGKAINETEREEVAREIVQDFGLQVCSQMAQVMLCHLLIGDVKKKQIALQQPTLNLIQKLNPSTLAGFMLLGLLLAGMALSSTALTCLIMRYYLLPGS